MSSIHSNIDRSLEFIQKTYNLQSITTNNEDHSFQQHRQSIGKVLIHQPSRKNSVHDIQQISKEDFNKILIDIQENLSRFKFLLETINSVQTIRQEFYKIKDHLFIKINEFIFKLAQQSSKRSSISSKGNLIDHPEYLVYSIEYFRNELNKAEYLFSSLTSSASIGSSTLNTIIIKPIEQIYFNNQDIQKDQDIQQIQKDISNLEEHIYVLTQRYYSQIPDWHSSGETIGRTILNDGILINSVGRNVSRSRFNTFNQKFSRTSSMASNENSTFCNRIFEKCHFICCMCQPNYI